jgi:O-antigen ligase
MTDRAAAQTTVSPLPAAAASPRDQVFAKAWRVLVLATFAVAGYTYVREWTEIAVISGFHLHVTDLLVAAALASFAGAARRRSLLSAAEFALLALCSLLLLNFARGVLATGATNAGNAFRPYSGFIATTALALVAPPPRDNLAWVFDKVVLLGWGLILLSLLRLALGLDAFIAKENDAENWGEARTLNGAGALMLAEALLIALNRAFCAAEAQVRRRNWVATLAFAAALVVSDQRTAIFAAVTGVMVVIFMLPRRVRPAALAAVSVAAVAASGAFFIGVIATNGELESRLASTLASHDDTYDWRIQQWGEYLDLYASAPPLDQLVGLPIGVGHAAGLASKGSLLINTAHSEYIALLIGSGAIGEFLFVLTLIVTAGRGVALLARGAGERAPQLGLTLAIIVMLAIFCYTYALPDEQGLLLALAARTIFAVRAKPRGPFGQRSSASSSVANHPGRREGAAEPAGATGGKP